MARPRPLVPPVITTREALRSTGADGPEIVASIGRLWCTALEASRPNRFERTYPTTRTSWGQPQPSATRPAHILAVSRSGTSMTVIPPRYSVVSV